MAYEGGRGGHQQDHADDPHPPESQQFQQPAGGEASLGKGDNGGLVPAPTGGLCLLPRVKDG